MYRILASTFQTASEVHLWQSRNKDNEEEYKKCVSQLESIRALTLKDAITKFYSSDAYILISSRNKGKKLYFFYQDLSSRLHRYFSSTREILALCNINEVSRLYKTYQSFLAKGLTPPANLITDFIYQENQYDHSGLTVEEATDYLLKRCSETTTKKYWELYNADCDDSPEIQFEIAKILLQASVEAQKNSHPHSSACQIILESHRAPALYWAIEAVNNNYLPAYAFEGMLIKNTSADINAYPALSFALLLHAALQGDLSAQQKLAFEHSLKETPLNLGRAVDYDIDLARFWYERIAEKDAPETYYDLATYYCEQLNNDYLGAITYYSKLVSLGIEKHYIDIIKNYMIIDDTAKAADVFTALLKTDDCVVLKKAYQFFSKKVFKVLNDVDLEISMLNRIFELSNDREMHMYFAECYHRQGDKLSFKNSVYSILSSNDNILIAKAFNFFTQNVFANSDYIDLEIEYLNHANACGNKNAAIILNQCYKKGIWGKWKKTKKWVSSAKL